MCCRSCADRLGEQPAPKLGIARRKRVRDPHAGRREKRLKLAAEQTLVASGRLRIEPDQPRTEVGGWRTFPVLEPTNVRRVSR